MSSFLNVPTFLVMLFFLSVFFKNSQEWTERNLRPKINFGQVIFLSALSGMAFFLAIRGIIVAGGYTEFLYFNF